MAHPPEYYERFQGYDYEWRDPIDPYMGRPGYLELCEHGIEQKRRLIEWSTVANYVRQLSKLDPPEDLHPAKIELTMSVCNSESHRLTRPHAAERDKAGHAPGYTYSSSMTMTGSKNSAIKLHMERTSHLQLPKTKSKLTPTDMTRLLIDFSTWHPGRVHHPRLHTPGPHSLRRGASIPTGVGVYTMRGRSACLVTGASSHGRASTPGEGTKLVVSHRSKAVPVSRATFLKPWSPAPTQQRASSDAGSRQRSLPTPARGRGVSKLPTDGQS